MTYCDTSFLVALYLKNDFFHAQAIRLASRFTGPIPFTLLAELELGNGIRRSLSRGALDLKEHDAIFRQISDDEVADILVPMPLSQAEHFRKARDLSKKFTPELSSRSLDILHVAAALLLHATEFASFDEKQRTLAVKAGLKILPAIVIKKKG